jgi:hypothetical protein
LNRGVGVHVIDRRIESASPWTPLGSGLEWLVLLDLLARVTFALPILYALQPADDAVRYFSVKDPDPERMFAWFILNAFFFIAVALLITLGIGIAFGAFRVWLLEKYPHNRFNGVPEDDPGETFRLRDTGE